MKKLFLLTVLFLFLLSSLVSAEDIYLHCKCDSITENANSTVKCPKNIGDFDDFTLQINIAEEKFYLNDNEINEWKVKDKTIELKYSELPKIEGKSYHNLFILSRFTGALTTVRFLYYEDGTEMFDKAIDSMHFVDRTCTKIDKLL